MTSLLWTFPVLMFASVVIGWAAELTAVHLSAGIALALLAWLQTAPEFAVEATIAWSQDAHLALANLTGSLRLLLGFGWPVIFFIYWFSSQRRHRKIKGKVKPVTGFRVLHLSENFAVEAVGLAVPVVYFLFIYLKGTWNALDGVILCSFYAFYFWLLNFERKQHKRHDDILGDDHDDSEDEPWVVRQVLKLNKKLQLFILMLMFVGGGLTLWFVVHPFLESLKEAALHFGVSDFVFIQWIAPIASEMPEKITAFNWARKSKKVSMAVVNMLSSVTSQWTLLAGLVPILFTISAGRWNPIVLSEFQKMELLLTIVQSAVAVVLLADLKIKDFEAVGFFVLWLVQFFIPNQREGLIAVYILWFIFESVRLVLNPSQCIAWMKFISLFSKEKS